MIYLYIYGVCILVIFMMYVYLMFIVYECLIYMFYQVGFSCTPVETWSQGHKTFFMLNSTEHEISTPHKNLNSKKILDFEILDVVFILLINVKTPRIVGVLTSMSRVFFMLS